MDNQIMQRGLQVCLDLPRSALHGEFQHGPVTLKDPHVYLAASCFQGFPLLCTEAGEYKNSVH